MKKRIAIALPAVLLMIGVAFFLIQNTFRFDEREIRIETPEGAMTGVLAMPKDREKPAGVIVFVHGDGPTNAAYDDAYKPLWEAFADEGYASLSLNKRGIGGSEGSWLEQSMEDRARDTEYAVQWAREQPDLDPDRIGLWGASQAGWVMPKVARDEPELRFAILVAPAVDWIKQGQYNTRAEMKRAGASTGQIEEAERRDAAVLELLQAGASYETYMKKAGERESSSISRERWTFIRRNFEEDSADELAYFKQPVHLVLGGRDLNVDSDDTENVYRAKIPKRLLTVTRLPDADHSMLKRRLSESDALTALTAVFMPRELFDDGYLSDMRTFLRTMDKGIPEKRAGQEKR
ncbi:alpha/beta hydrolase [Saccharibacillus sp. O23]|uniref:alpha/beta hydrolase family protein n=1 Tax=Saccharibacillus sp. O23 TaxID=2009338 RepID=UPI000B4E385F|nr:alpha/beta fold hydrolase [Saccharibacillus sp. O23]OWR28997.1 alpha/beta hydrolase [Saccharibacillus sp. O23]